MLPDLTQKNQAGGIKMKTLEECGNDPRFVEAFRQLCESTFIHSEGCNIYLYKYKHIGKFSRMLPAHGDYTK